MAPVEYKIFLLNADKSANLVMQKCASYFRRINQSCSKLPIAVYASHLRVSTLANIQFFSKHSKIWPQTRPADSVFIRPFLSYSAEISANW